MELYLNQLKTYYFRKNDTYYYYNDYLLENDTVIKLKQGQFLIVSVLDGVNTREFTMLSEFLPPILLRRTIEDIFELFIRHELQEFIYRMKALAESYISSRRQESEKVGLEMTSEMVWELSLLKSTNILVKEGMEEE